MFDTLCSPSSFTRWSLLWRAVALFAAIWVALASGEAMPSNRHAHDHATFDHEPHRHAHVPDDGHAAGVPMSTHDTPTPGEPGHRHSGDALLDLLTVGHSHLSGSSFPGLLPGDWIVPASVGLRHAFPHGRDRAAEEGPGDSPFRPPIA